MSLKEYVRKRKFENTPEPAPATLEPAERTQGRLFIQRHDATRLHYDLRLEIGGTLKSWAVPKGPSQIPLSKQLAMHVEDHPLSYGDFEGNIPKGNYGAGSVMLWDFGTFEVLGDGDGEAQLARGDLKFRAEGQKMKGEFALVLMKGRGKGNEWLLIKKRDEFADESYDIEALAYSVKTGRTQEEIAQDLPPQKKKKSSSRKKARLSPADLPGAKEAPLPSNVQAMLATPADRPPQGGNWVYEIKWDGVRAICYIEDGHIRMVSRNGNSFDRQYPELTVVPRHVAANTAILDGEIAVLDEQGRARFGLIQPRIHQTNANEVAHLARKTPVKLFAFDLLYWDGYDLRGVPLEERKRALTEIVTPGDRIQVSEHFQVDGEEILEAARQMGLEGVIAKDPTGKYEPKRSRSWLKLKVTGQQEFVICGYTHGERALFSSLVLGVHDEGGKLRYVGCVGTGFDDKKLRDIYAKLKPLETKTNPFGQRIDVLRKVTWVEPRLMCEVRFTEWTQDSRLRAPVFIRLREDKAATEVKRDPIVPDADRPADEPLCPPGRKEVTRVIEGRTLKFTNLDKVWFPKDGYTKRDILNYYDSVAHLIVPHLAGRPLSLKRYPNGIHEDFFFQKDIPEGYPSWLRIEPIYSEHRGEPIRFVVADDRATLLFLTNLGCIDQNPWMSRVETLDYPDYVLIDLDPQECTFDRILEAMTLVKGVLDEIGLQGYPKTTGGDGMHVFVPVEPRYTYDQARSFAEILAQVVIGERPELFTTPRSVAKRRKGRVYFDYLQISSGKTIAGPYVTRAYDGAPVATPLHWDEVKKGLTPKTFTIENAPARFREVGDLFEPVLKKPQKLEPALKKLAKLIQD